MSFISTYFDVLDSIFCCLVIVAYQRYGSQKNFISSPDQSSCQKTRLERYKLPGTKLIVILKLTVMTLRGHEMNYSECINT